MYTYWQSIHDINSSGQKFGLRMKKAYLVHTIITITVMLFIFIQSALPGDLSGAESNMIVQFIAGLTGWNEEALSIVVRKAAHFTEFLILGTCLCINMRDLRTRRIRAEETSAASVRGYCLAAWLIGTAYAVTDEFHQLFVPGRACSLMDICIDSAGVATGILMYCILNAGSMNAAKRAW